MEEDKTAKPKVIQDKRLTRKGRPRYVVVDSETGEVLDNAQGYGYKDIRGAYAAYAYKNRDKSKDAAKEARKQHIRSWMKEHKSFVRCLDGYAFEICKGSWEPDDKVDAKFVRDMWAEWELKPDFTAGEFLRVWRGR